jgi:hypothetical protein
VLGRNDVQRRKTGTDQWASVVRGRRGPDGRGPGVSEKREGWRTDSVKPGMGRGPISRLGQIGPRGLLFFFDFFLIFFFCNLIYFITFA